MSDEESPSTKALLQASVSALFSIRPAASCELSEPETGTVATVIKGETLRLAHGRIVRLIGAKAPLPPLGSRGYDL
jgi:endonuclease YncB( thermonuclease family)